MIKLSFPVLPFCPERMHSRELAGECRPDAPRAYEELWRHWREQLHALRFEPAEEDGRDVLCLWLEEDVERAVDALWKSSPSRAYMAHLLALELCMAALRALVPEADFTGASPVGAGCAPLAAPDAGQVLKLQELGILSEGFAAGSGAPVLLRRYAVLTWLPFRNDCGGCSLRQGCPRRGEL